ncbi:Endoglucanase 13, partial [Ananas comosus]
RPNRRYFDAGDNVKFGFPMAFTTTLPLVSVVEYGSQLGAKNELWNALAAIRWGSDYLINAHPSPDVLYVEVGDGDSDHACWQRPEDMTTPRNSMNWFGLLHGSSTPPMTKPTSTTFKTEAMARPSEFSWDDKFVGAQTLVSKGKIPNDGAYWQYKNNADQFICSVAQKGTTTSSEPRRMLWWHPWNDFQYTTAALLVLTAHADHLASAGAPQGASIVSIKRDRNPVSCQGGFSSWFNKNEPNPNVIDGAIVGGPDANDGYTDSRSNYQQTEPATVTTAPFVGVLARIA